MTTQDQEFTTPPETTPPTARSVEPPSANRRPFSMRGCTSLLLTMAFLVMAVSGTLLFLTPRGRVANWTGWTMLGLDKHQWGELHIIIGILFMSISGLHLYLNWSLFLGYLKKKAATGLRMKRELAVATAIAIFCVVGAITSIPPFSSVMALNDDIKDYWEDWAIEAPVPHAEELTLAKFAGHINLSLDELTKALQKEGFTVDNSELTVGEVGRQKGVSPNDVLTAIQKHHPKAGASRNERGQGGGRGQGFGRSRESGGYGEDGSSHDREGLTASNHQSRSGNAEEADGMKQRSGGFGSGRGMGQGQGRGMGRDRDEGLGAGSGFSGHSSNAEPNDDKAFKHSSSGGSNSKLKGRTIIEKGESITASGTLKRYGDEWQLVSQNGIHNIHLGPEEYQKSQGIKITEGTKATVTGFSIDEDIAVCSIKISGKTYVFRNKEGRPAWAGGGQGQGRNRRTAQ